MEVMAVTWSCWLHRYASWFMPACWLICFFVRPYRPVWLLPSFWLHLTQPEVELFLVLMLPDILSLFAVSAGLPSSWWVMDASWAGVPVAFAMSDSDASPVMSDSALSMSDWSTYMDEPPNRMV